MSNYFGFAGAGEINRAGAIALLDSYLPQDDVEIVVPQTMESPGLIELYNWLDVEFTGIEISEDPIVEHLRLLAQSGNKVSLILLKDAEHPEDEFLRQAHNAGIDVLDLNNSLHPVEWAPPKEPPKGGRRRKTTSELAEEGNPEAQQAVEDYAKAEAEHSTVSAEIAGPATKSPQWIERFEEDGTLSPVDILTQQGMTNLGQIEDELFGTLRVLIRFLVAQEVAAMSLTPGVRTTTENFGQTPLAEPAASTDPEEKKPYLHNKETGKYTSRENKKGRPPKGSEVVYLVQSEIDALVSKDLIENLSSEIPGQMELPFD